MRFKFFFKKNEKAEDDQQAFIFQNKQQLMQQYPEYTTPKVAM